MLPLSGIGSVCLVLPRSLGWKQEWVHGPATVRCGALLCVLAAAYRRSDAGAGRCAAILGAIGVRVSGLNRRRVCSLMTGKQFRMNPVQAKVFQDESALHKAVRCGNRHSAMALTPDGVTRRRSLSACARRREACRHHWGHRYRRSYWCCCWPISLSACGEMSSHMGRRRSSPTSCLP